MTKQRIFKEMTNDIAWEIKYDNTFLNKGGLWTEKAINELIDKWESKHWRNMYLDYINERVFNNMVNKVRAHFIRLLNESKSTKK